MKQFTVLNDHSFTYNGITFGIFKDEFGTELNTIFNDSWDPVDDYCYFDTGHLTIDETIDHLKDDLKHWNETVENILKEFSELLHYQNRSSSMTRQNIIDNLGINENIEVHESLINELEKITPLADVWFRDDFYIHSDFDESDFKKVNICGYDLMIMQ